MKQTSRFLLLYVCSFLLLSLAATSSRADDSSRYTTVYHGISAELIFTSAPLVTMRPTPFTLTVRDTNGAPLSGLDLVCALTMPAMPMPPNRPEVTADVDSYRGTATFTMAGAWQATFRATHQDGKRFDLVFDIPAVLMK